MSEGFAPASTLETGVDDPMVGRQLGPNLVLAKLAAGGMAEIFLANQKGALGVSRLVVVKRILPSLAENEQFRSMFYDEARIAAQLEHPNIIRVEDFGEDPEDKSLYMVMEYVEGVPMIDTLKRAAKAKQPIDVRWAATVVAQAAEGLHFAHELLRSDGSGENMGVVHRDVSPHNILVTPNGIVKVFDFGIAKAMDRMTQTAAGVVKGKFAYMSPEQARGGVIDRRSDVFSLAIVLWETLTLKRLFSRGNDLDTYRALLETRVPRASELRSDVYPEVDDVLRYALAREPENRFATARAFGQAVAHAVAYHGGMISNAQLGEPIRQHFGEQLAARKKLAARRMTMPPGLRQTNQNLRRVDEIQLPGGVGVLAVPSPPRNPNAISGQQQAEVPPFTPGPVSMEQVVQRPASGPYGAQLPPIDYVRPGFSGQRPAEPTPSEQFRAVATAMVRPPIDRGVTIQSDDHAEADEVTRGKGQRLPPRTAPAAQPDQSTEPVQRAAPAAAQAGLTATQKIIAIAVVALLAAGVIAAMTLGS